MPETIMTCRVCGKRYKACKTPNTSGIFRWRDVACSPECGTEYLRRVQLARSGESVATTVIVSNSCRSESAGSDADVACNCGCVSDEPSEPDVALDTPAVEINKKRKSGSPKNMARGVIMNTDADSDNTDF